MSLYLLLFFGIKALFKMMYCPKCGKENSDDARFCMHCGADLSEYKVEISPKIEVSPIINISMFEKQIIERKVGETIQEKKIKLTPEEEQIVEQLEEIPLEELFSPQRKQERDRILRVGRKIYEEGLLPPEEKQKADAFTQVFVEGLQKRGKIDLSMYDRQTLEKCVEFIDNFIGDDSLEDLMKIKETKDAAEAVWTYKRIILKYLRERME